MNQISNKYQEKKKQILKDKQGINLIFNLAIIFCIILTIIFYIKYEPIILGVSLSSLFWIPLVNYIFQAFAEVKLKQIASYYQKEVIKLEKTTEQLPEEISKNHDNNH